MQKLSSLKIYAIAVLYTILPQKIRQIFCFKLTPAEHLAIGTTLAKIKYWWYFIKKNKRDNRLHFTSSKYPS
ncbi:MAG TPA: hypothetical protein VFW07_26670 [Parafilimonas sp.]|nr:hypothetical protein [Parafilimonas sp.]